MTIAADNLASPPGLHRRMLALRELPILAALVLLVAVTAVAEPRFVGADSTREILVAMALVAVLAMGETAVMLTRGVDASVGSIVGLSGMAVGLMFRDQRIENVYLGTLAAVCIGGAL